MSSESVKQVVPSWVDVGGFHTRLVARVMIITASVRNILDTSSYKILAGARNQKLTESSTKCYKSNVSIVERHNLVTYYAVNAVEDDRCLLQRKYIIYRHLLCINERHRMCTVRYAHFKDTLSAVFYNRVILLYCVCL
jgi:hypothetical protein